MRKNWIVIPAFEPGERLSEYIKEIKEQIEVSVIVVDDGSGSEYCPVFDGVRQIKECVVLRHDENRGKGKALKTAFAYLAEHAPRGSRVVCVDCDGQHAPEDVRRIFKAAKEEPGALHLGVRDFSKEDVPFRSWFGNRVTSCLVWLVCGKWLEDTQTGLRAFGKDLLPEMLAIPGERFEYETQMLLTCVKEKIPVRAQSIQTIYEEGNEGSHFRPLKDSIRVLKILFSEMIRFGMASLSCAALDVFLFWCFSEAMFRFVSGRSTVTDAGILTGSAEEMRLCMIIIATLCARVIAAGTNYFLNRDHVFRDGQTVRGKSAAKYAALCVGIGSLSAVSVYFFNRVFFIGMTAAKILSDLALFFVSYRLQKAWVFRAGREKIPTGQGEYGKRNLIFILTMVFSGIYLLWRLFFTIPWTAGFLQGAMGLVLALAELTTTMGMCELMVSKMKGQKRTVTSPDIPEEMYPDVDVLIATHNEPAELLYKTINACTYLEYPDKDKVHVYVCDDGNRSEIALLAARFGVGYLGLADNKHAKSGNYNHALSCTRSPLIATFDSDMIPRREFLIRTVPYFLDPEMNMGLVQTPQSFYNQDLFQFNLFSEKDIPNEQDFFSREINVMRNSSNSAAYTGSNTVILRKALEEIGGFPYGTITEDFETSLRLQKAGYITYASEEVLAAGLSTTTVESMISQRVRWARGVIQSIRNTNAVFTKELSVAARMSYLNAYLYWWSFLCRMIFILAPILFALFDFQLVECGFGELLLFWLPSHLFYSISVRYLSTNIRSLRWSQIIDTILAPYLIIPVLLESVGISQKKFKVTDKKKQREKTTTWRYMIPHSILILLTAAAMLRYIHGKYGLALVYSSVIIFWLGYNMMALVYAVFFMLGRKAKRRYDRIGAEERIEFEYQGTIYVGKTEDLSEKGIAWSGECGGQQRLPKPGERMEVVIVTEHYRAKLRVEIVYVSHTEKGTRFAASAEPVSEPDMRNWLQIIHDRAHSLPKEIDPWRTVYDDIVRNVHMRRQGWRRNKIS